MAHGAWQKGELEVRDLGIMTYEQAMQAQQAIVDRRIRKEIPDTLLIVEHFPVVTMGRLAMESSIIDRDYFHKKGIPVIETNRGGKITYHSPGQLVLYPVIDLGEKKKDIAFYIDLLEKTAVRSLGRLGVPAARGDGRRGVWVNGRKIAFIGIGIRRWVTFHGISVNINNDTEAFSKMHPCGENDIRVISAKRVIGRQIDMEKAREVFTEQFISDLEVEYAKFPPTRWKYTISTS